MTKFSRDTNRDLLFRDPMLLSVEDEKRQRIIYNEMLLREGRFTRHVDEKKRKTK